MSTTPPTTLAVGDRAELRRRAADVGLRGAARRRACIVLLAAAGLSTTEIAARLGVSRPTAAAWRTRYERAGLAGLCDVARPGRPRRVDREQIIRATLDPVPVHLGSRRWTCRALLAEHLGVGSATVARAWRQFGVVPQPAGGFVLGTAPPLRAGTVTLVGVLAGVGGRVAVLAVDEAAGPCPPTDGGWPIDLVRRCAAQRPGSRLHVVADPLGRVGLRGTAAARSWWAQNPAVELHGLARETSWDLLVSVCHGVSARAHGRVTRNY